MNTKHSKEVNKEVMHEDYFSDVLDMMYDNVEKTEELYDEVHEKFSNNQPTGFSLGSTRSSTEIIKALSDIRATSVASTTALFNAKRYVVELEIKKKNQIVEEDKAQTDRDFIRTALEEIKNNSKSTSFEINKKTGKNSEISILDNIIKEKMNSGEIKLTSNEKAMKYDFNNEVEPVYDTSTESIKAVKRGTKEVVTDYPLERFQIDTISRVDLSESKAYSTNGKVIKTVKL